MKETHLHKSKGNQHFKKSLAARFSSYFIRHLQVIFSSLGRLCRSPFSSIMTVSVIGIALALPTGLHLLMKNFETVTSGWDGAAQISLFIKKHSSLDEINTLKTNIQKQNDIDSVKYISASDAMVEFKNLSGFGQALDALDENPLPPVLVVKPSINQSSPEQLNTLVERFSKEKIVELAQLDMLWIKRLYSIMDIITKGVWIIGALLAISVLLIVGNTIRLDIQNRKEEILVIKLVGATNAFIRRPFLYTGVWYGLAGGLIAFLLISSSLTFLATPIGNLSALYNSNFEVKGLGFQGFIVLTFISTSLGLIGSWISVSRHIKNIEPT